MVKTWIFEEKSRFNKINRIVITSNCCISGYLPNQQKIFSIQQQQQQHSDNSIFFLNICSIEKVLIERQYRLCHSKKLYCVLLYYEPIYVCDQYRSITIDNVPNEKTFYSSVLMPSKLLNKQFKLPQTYCLIRKFLKGPFSNQLYRSRRRQRRRHLNSFCDNFKTI